MSNADKASKAKVAAARVAANESPVKWMTDRQWMQASDRERLVAVADSQNGATESPKGSNRGPEVNEYLASVLLPGGYSWCAAFVHWCIKTACDVDVKDPRSHAGVKTWFDEASKRHWLKSSPDRGDIVGWVNRNDLGHIFICLGKPVLGFVRTIEGNTNDGGGREGIEVRKRVRSIASIKRNYRYFFIDTDKLIRNA